MWIRMCIQVCQIVLVGDFHLTQRTQFNFKPRLGIAKLTVCLKTVFIPFILRVMFQMKIFFTSRTMLG